MEEATIARIALTEVFRNKDASERGVEWDAIGGDTIGIIQTTSVGAKR